MEYIDKTNLIVNNAEYTAQEVIIAIEQLEKEAINELSEIEIQHLLSYTATARASYAYWSENLEEWNDLLLDQTESSRALLVTRIAYMVLSDGAGAIAGAALATLYTGNPTIIGAAAVLCGTVSSAYSWMTGKICIILPTDLMERVYP